MRSREVEVLHYLNGLCETDYRRLIVGRIRTNITFNRHNEVFDNLVLIKVPIGYSGRYREVIRFNRTITTPKDSKPYVRPII